MSAAPASGPIFATGRVKANGLLCDGMHRLDLELPRPTAFAPGQFAMLNFGGRDRLIFGRPLSILAVEAGAVSFLYRVAGEGTSRLAAVAPGAELAYFGPLGNSLPPRDDGPPRLLLAGGVGLPPLLAWHHRHGREADLALFGARAPQQVPWTLLSERWAVSVDSAGQTPAGRAAFEGTVVALADKLLARRPERDWRLLACGPLPMLRAAARLAAARGWSCLVCVEERMGCGYGVCRGCVVPARAGDWLTACQDGPVLDAATIDWERFGASAPTPGGGS